MVRYSTIIRCFPGWKIAALAGCGSAVVFSASALLFAVLAFCHRTFICASTVVVTIAAILSSIGVTVFYAWANYQDNKVIKEDGDTTYEQILGWAFYCQIFTTVIHWLASMLGCCVTSVSFSKSRAKLVKIEVVEGGDERQLLSGPSSSQPFKRSFSAIYRVDSQSLRQWERDYMRNARERQQQSEGSSFKRTASMPNFSKKQRKAAQRKLADRSSRELFSSASNITDTTQTGQVLQLGSLRFLSGCHHRMKQRTIACRLKIVISRIGEHFGVESSAETHSRRHASYADHQPSALPALPKLKSALKTPQQSRKSVNIDDSDVTYECLPCDASAGVSSLFGGRPSSSLRGHQYDPVYEQIGQENYLEPNSVRMRSNQALNIDQDKKALLPTQPLPGSSQSIPTSHQKTTVIDDVPSTPATKPTTPSRVDKPPLSIREFGVSLTPKKGYCDIETTFDSAGPSSKSVSSSNHIKYSELEKGPDVRRPSLPHQLSTSQWSEAAWKDFGSLQGDQVPP
ncbi:Clc-like protein [Ostertagia ostertagi]